MTKIISYLLSFMICFANPSFVNAQTTAVVSAADIMQGYINSEITEQQIIEVVYRKDIRSKVEAEDLLKHIHDFQGSAGQASKLGELQKIVTEVESARMETISIFDRLMDEQFSVRSAARKILFKAMNPVYDLAILQRLVKEGKFTVPQSQRILEFDREIRYQNNTNGRFRDGVVGTLSFALPIVGAIIGFKLPYVIANNLRLDGCWGVIATLTGMAAGTVAGWYIGLGISKVIEASYTPAKRLDINPLILDPTIDGR